MPIAVCDQRLVHVCKLKREPASMDRMPALLLRQYIVLFIASIKTMQSLSSKSQKRGQSSEDTDRQLQ